MQLNFENFNFQLKTDINGEKKIFDEIRRKYVALTPEEWVRQHVIHQLISNGFPKGRLSVERTLPASKKRYDLVYFDVHGQPQLLVECKAPSIAINQKTIQQVANYIQQMDCPIILLSNGFVHVTLFRTTDQFKIVKDFPQFSEEKNVFLSNE